MRIGETIEFANTLPEPWFKHLPAYPKTLSGTVQKLFKNGNVAVAVHQLPNGSEDGCRTIHFKQDTMHYA